jgi:hypothetical protein
VYAAAIAVGKKPWRMAVFQHQQAKAEGQYSQLTCGRLVGSFVSS